MREFGMFVLAMAAALLILLLVHRPAPGLIARGARRLLLVACA